MARYFYTNPDKRLIGKTESSNLGSAYGFTWSMMPLQFARFFRESFSESDTVVDSDGTEMSTKVFASIVDGAFSQYYKYRMKHDE